MKKTYSTPEIELIKLDNEISLQLSSTEDLDPMGEPGGDKWQKRRSISTTTHIKLYNNSHNMNALKKAVLSAMILFLGAVAIHAAEDKEWLREGSLTERTENWTQSSSLRSTSEDNTPPTEPWGTPIGDGMWCIVVAAGIYGLCKMETPFKTVKR